MNLLLITACCSAALLMLVSGIVAYRRVLQVNQPMETLIRFSPVLMAVSLAIFSMEHFFDTTELAAIVPAWLPFTIFWTYAVGVALLAAAISFVVRKQMRWSATLLTLLFLTFVVAIHVPNTVAHWKERVFWTLIVRESLFAAGTLVLAASLWRDSALKANNAVPKRIRRTIAAIALLFRSAAVPASEIRSRSSFAEINAELDPFLGSLALPCRRHFSCSRDEASMVPHREYRCNAGGWHSRFSGSLSLPAHSSVGIWDTANIRRNQLCGRYLTCCCSRAPLRIRQR